MPLRLNPTFREVLAARAAGDGRALVGMWVCSGSALVAEVCAGSGVDWVLVDMEHSPNGLESVLAQLQAVAAYPVTPVVRVPVGDVVTIKQVLDVGAQNLLVPMVSSADDARAVVEAVRYPPRGRRGVGSALARSARWGRVEGYVDDADEHVSLVVQVETAEGVEAAGDIAAVEGVDGVLVGPADLSASMGLRGRQRHPDVVAAVLRTFEAVRAAGKPVGVNAFEPDAAREYAHAGASFVAVGADVTLLARGSEALAGVLADEEG
ncbi:HpcH/HpaI aldolase/citrate lyase family protein [Actinotalea sp. AC32]|nr:HpcH/HpaI aldolase/citrate lyase family protein [Actinotalea sp. AC32]